MKKTENAQRGSRLNREYIPSSARKTRAGGASRTGTRSLPKKTQLLPIFDERLRESTLSGREKVDNFCSDKSRIVFSSSFRRLVQKAQVFSLESNTSVRNRLTHSLEVADIGRTLARTAGKRLHDMRRASDEERLCMEAIVENACLLHDIGNPPFGHFGEEAIKQWFKARGPELVKSVENGLNMDPEETHKLNDFYCFDGNPQGFRIASRLHCEIDQFGLNLTVSTLLASIKYPNCGSLPKSGPFRKKLGVFSSERDRFDELQKRASLNTGKRYFLAYLMELADDICYCLSDIADSFEKRITTSREFKAEFGKICKDVGISSKSFLPEEKIENFAYQVSIGVARRLIEEASVQFAENLDLYLSGDAPEILDSIPSGKLLGCFKQFARNFIYTDREAQRIEIAGETIVKGLLDHFGRLLLVSRSDFEMFAKNGMLRKGSGLDAEWRIFNQLSNRMIDVYIHQSKKADDLGERICRARLVVDYISGLTDNSAKDVYQNVMGISI